MAPRRSWTLVTEITSTLKPTRPFLASVAPCSVSAPVGGVRELEEREAVDL